jgi:site-specific DNA-methyltransferase (adenine-specific)
MRPYYSDPWVTLYHSRCEDVLPTLDAASIDLVLTDPPYGISYVSNYRQQKFDAIAHDHAVPVEWVSELRRVAKFRTAVYWFACDDSLEETRNALLSIGFGLNTMLVWDKQVFTAGNLNDYGQQTEYIVFGTNGPTRLNGSRDPNLLSVPRINPRVMVHPTEKPIPLLSYLIMRSTGADEVVLDPFAGSGSTLIAAKDLGRKAIGIEIEERYCEIAATRLAQSVMAFGV